MCMCACVYVIDNEIMGKRVGANLFVDGVFRGRKIGSDTEVDILIFCADFLQVVKLMAGMRTALGTQN